MQGRGDAILRHGPERPAAARVVDVDEDRDDQTQGQSQHHGPPHGQERTAELIDAGGERGHAPLLFTEDKEGQALQEDRRSHRQQQRNFFALEAPHDGSEQEHFHDDADRTDPDKGGEQRDEIGKSEDDLQVIDDEPAEHVELAVGEVHHVHDAEDDREAQGYERIGHAHDEAVHENLGHAIAKAVLAVKLCSRRVRIPEQTRRAAPRWRGTAHP